MSDHPSLARLATDRLRAADGAPLPAPSPEARARAIAALGAAIAENAERRRRKRALRIGALAAAAGVLALVSVKVLHRPAPQVVEAMRLVGHPFGPVTLVHAGAESPMSVGAPLSRGDHVRTSTESHASVVISTGTQIEIDKSSELAVEGIGPEQVFVAQAGASKFSVAKLGTGQRFLVRTSDTEVEVRGTIFRVGVAGTACAGTFTRVDVSEGVVVVRHHGVETRLGAKDSWPSGCTDATAKVEPPSAPAVGPTPPVVVPSPVVSPALAPKPVVPSAPPQPAAPEAPSSDLAAQNDLFAEGLAKKRAGDKNGAALAFERLLARWPSSTLAESAAAERMRLLSGSAARAAAKDYLARFPKGSARAEAEILAQ